MWLCARARTNLEVERRDKLLQQFSVAVDRAHSLLAQSSLEDEAEGRRRARLLREALADMADIVEEINESE